MNYTENSTGSKDQWTMNDPLDVVDPEVYEIIKKEKKHQLQTVELIASVNFTSLAVLQSLGSCFHNKYAEGEPRARYYGGNEFTDEIELLCQKRALEAFECDPEEWGVNVQPLSGTPANFAVYTAVVEPHGRIMGLDLPDGGHLSHGYFTTDKKISATSIFFESLPYKVDPHTGFIDYDKLAESVRLFKPKLIIAGVSCYSRHLDYKRFREIADSCGAYLMADMAHIAGLVAAKVVPSPFPYCDIVTTTTHKTLRGARGGVIFYRQGVRSVNKNGENIMYDLKNKINKAVFPGLQGGPHINAISGIATCMKLAKTEEFRCYQEQVVKNAKILANKLQNLGYDVVTGGTDNHMMLLDLRSQQLSGSKGQKILEEIAVICNKNTVPGDRSAFNPSGIRLGTPTMSSRGMVETDMEKIADLIHSGLVLGKEIQAASGPKLADWNRVLATEEEFQTKVKKLKAEVQSFASKFPLPGFPDI